MFVTLPQVQSGKSRSLPFRQFLLLYPVCPYKNRVAVVDSDKHASLLHSCITPHDKNIYNKTVVYTSMFVSLGAYHLDSSFCFTLFVNIRTGWQQQIVTNTLAYYTVVLHTMAKSLILKQFYMLTCLRQRISPALGLELFVIFEKRSNFIANQCLYYCLSQI